MRRLILILGLSAALGVSAVLLATNFATSPKPEDGQQKKTVAHSEAKKPVPRARQDHSSAEFANHSVLQKSILSAVVVIGTVEQSLPPFMWDPAPSMEHPLAHTDTVIRVEKYVKNRGEDTITVRSPGGTIDGLTTDYESVGGVKFTPGQRVLLLLWKNLRHGGVLQVGSPRTYFIEGSEATNAWTGEVTPVEEIISTVEESQRLSLDRVRKELRSAGIRDEPIENEFIPLQKEIEEQAAQAQRPGN